MIVKCSCGKLPGVKKIFKRGTSHGLCKDCFERAIFSIKGYLFKWITYKGYEGHSRSFNLYNRIVGAFLGIVWIYMIGITIQYLIS